LETIKLEQTLIQKVTKTKRINTVNMILRDQCPNKINNTEKWLHPSIPSAKHSLLLKNHEVLMQF
jgi:hypothetical protein